MTETKAPYFPELSSIRGIAAIVVLFGHAFDIIQRAPAVRPLSATHSIYAAFEFIAASLNGNAAVEMFFVLSGLVLSLSLDRRSGAWTGWVSAFYIRRVYRIYPALWVSLIVVIGLLPFEQIACGSGICTRWATTAFQQSYTSSQISRSFLGIFVRLNGPTWSLRVELFYSLLFPLIFLALRSPKAKLPSLLLFLLLAVAPIPRLFSIHYILAFALGSLIPLYKVGNRGIPFRCLTLLAVAVLIFSPQALARFNMEDKTLEIIEMFASFAIVYAIFHRHVDTPFLRNRTLFYFGEISYSVYVLHFPLLFSLFYAETAGVRCVRHA